MNWIWEDEISSITIDRHVPCIISFCKIDKTSVEQLSEYLQELRKTLRRFPEIYPDLKMILRYNYDGSIALNSITPLLKELSTILSTAKSTRIGLVNEGEGAHELPLEVLMWKQGQPVKAKHFVNEGKAKTWLTMSGAAVL